MKLKLALLLSIIVVGLSGCGATDTPTNTANTSASPASATSSPATTAQNNPNMIEASANPTATTGGTKEGCKCSAVGMACNTKAGEKGCCGGKDGSCSMTKDGLSKCCSTTGKDGAACCSTAKTTASADHKNMKGMDDKAATEKKAGT